VAFYRKIPEQSLENIKKEVNMEFVETTISEHIFNQGMIKGISEGESRGESRGEARGKAEGRRETAANLLKIGIDMKIITQATGLSEEEIKKLV
jgi:predicted transposase/invertase (TIGR01784 family)